MLFDAKTMALWIEKTVGDTKINNFLSLLFFFHIFMFALHHILGPAGKQISEAACAIKINKFQSQITKIQTHLHSELFWLGFFVFHSFAFKVTRRATAISDTSNGKVQIPNGTGDCWLMQTASAFFSLLNSCSRSFYRKIRHILVVAFHTYTFFVSCRLLCILCQRFFFINVYERTALIKSSLSHILFEYNFHVFAACHLMFTRVVCRVASSICARNEIMRQRWRKNTHAVCVKFSKYFFPLFSSFQSLFRVCLFAKGFRN